MDEPALVAHPVRAVWATMSQRRRGIAVAGLLGAVAAGSAVALLGTSGWLISKAAEQPPVLTLGVAAVLVRAFALGRAVARYAERLVGHDAAFRGLTELRVVVYRNLERLAPTGLAGFGRGDLLNRLVADVDAALDLPLRVVLPWIQAVLVTVATVVFLSWLLPASGVLVAVLAVGGIVLVPWLSAGTAAAAEARIAPEKAELTGLVVRALDAASELSTFGATRPAAAAIRSSDVGLTRLNVRESYGLGLGAGASVLMQGLAVVGALVAGVLAVVDGRIEPVWLAVVALVPLALFDVLAGLPSSALAFQRLRGSARRIAEVEAQPSPVADPDEPLPLAGGFTGLHLRDVGARWIEGSSGDVATALIGVTFDVEPGQRVAVVGPSGAGKSTLAAVVTGFLPYSGSIMLNGAQMSACAGDDVRERIGVLTQQAHIFDTSISANVRIGDPNQGQARLDEVVAQAQLGGWLATLDDGLETAVGAFGVGVSGGERQRIALARLLLADRPFVVLDEPTEHLDAPTADELMRTLDVVLAGKAMLLITHRLLGLEGFDCIVELRDGHVVSMGTHDELMAANGWYAEQWSTEHELRDMAELLPRLPIGIGVAGPAADARRA